MRINPTSSLLLVVDIQSALLPAIDGGEAVLGHTGWLIDVAQTIGIPVLATEHCPQRIGVTDARLRDKFRPEAIVEKEHFSAVSEGALLRAPDAERRQWIVTGTEAHVCVQQTALDLRGAGKQVFIVAEASGSRAPANRDLAFERMRGHGIEIVSREMVAFEWLQRGGTELFREVNRDFIR